METVPASVFGNADVGRRRYSNSVFRASDLHSWSYSVISALYYLPNSYLLQRI